MFDTIVDEYRLDENHIFLNMNRNNILLSIQKDYSKLNIKQSNYLSLTLEIIYDFAFKLSARFCSDAERLEKLNNLLQRMYLSEIGLSNNHNHSKELPVYFIGLMCYDMKRNQSIESFYLKLSKLLSYWDDWIDIKEDLKKNHSNHFLSRNRNIRLLQNLFLNNYLFHWIIYKRHLRIINDIITICDDLDTLTKDKTLEFLFFLFCEKPKIFN